MTTVVRPGQLYYVCWNDEPATLLVVRSLPAGGGWRDAWVVWYTPCHVRRPNEWYRYPPDGPRLRSAYRSEMGELIMDVTC